MCEKERINARLQEYLPCLRSGDGDTSAQTGQDFRDKFSDFVRAQAVANDPCLELDDDTLAEVTDEAFRLILKKAGNKNQQSLTLSDLKWVIDTACVNRRLAAFLPDLGREEKHQEFVSEFWDRGVRCAHEISGRQYQHGHVQDEDLVQDAFEKIFRKAAQGDLKGLTWAYVKQAINNELRLIVLRPKRRKTGRDVGLTDEDRRAPEVQEDSSKVWTDWCDGAKLTPQERLLVELKHLYRLTWKEMVGAPGRPASWEELLGERGATEATAQRIHKQAIKKLRRWLKKEYGLDAPSQSNSAQDDDGPAETRRMKDESDPKESPIAGGDNQRTDKGDERDKIPNAASG